MSDIFWIGQIDCAKRLIEHELSELEQKQKLGIKLNAKPLLHHQRKELFNFKEVDGVTLVSSGSDHGSCPGLLGWLSHKLQVSTQMVDWNDQIGFSHYSQFVNGVCTTHFTYWQLEFFEHGGIDYDQIVADGRRNATEKTMYDYFKYPEHEPHYVFDHLTKNFDFWGLYDQLAGEDYEFEDCTPIEIPTRLLNLQGLGLLDEHGKLFPWKVVSKYSPQLSLVPN